MGNGGGSVDYIRGTHLVLRLWDSKSALEELDFSELKLQLFLYEERPKIVAMDFVQVWKNGGFLL